MVLTAGIISLISAGSNSAKLSTTAASGGTAPYTQQWYRDTSGAGFTPGVGNMIHNGTGLTLNGAGLVPNTTYYYKVVYTDATTSTVTSAAFVVTTLPASQGMNQFSMAAILGQLDLQSGPKNVVAAQVDAAQSTPLYPGQPVKFVNSPYGIPTVVAAGSSMPNGYIVYDQKSPNFPAGFRCELARTETCIWLYSTSVIDRGSMVTLDPNVASGVQQVTGISTLPIIGEAFDESIASGQLIRIILNVPSNTIDIAVIVSNILEIDSSLTEELITQHLLRSIINGVPSNQVAVQIPISSPTLDNLVTMDASGYVKDSGIAITTDPSSNDNTHAPTTMAMQAAILAGVTAGYIFQGGYDASSNVFPSVNKTGGPIAIGNFWIITVPGNLGGTPVFINDEILALINVPGQTAANWAINGSVSKAYVDAQLALKAALAGAAFTGEVTVQTPTNPTDAARKDYVDSAVSTINTALALKAALAGAAFTGEVTVQTPTNPTDAARKDYVDNGLATKEPTITNLPVTKGGTGLVLYTIGDVIYASGTTTLSKLSAVAIGSVYASGGVGAAPILTNAPAFGGNPTAPNIAAGDASLKLANTNFVNSASILTDIQNVSVSQTITSTSDFILALNSNTSSPTFLNGSYIAQIVTASGTVILEFSLAETLGAGSTALPQNKYITINKVEDASGTITLANIAEYMSFINYLRTNVTNPYFAVCVRFPAGSLYGTTTVTITCTANSQNFNRQNTALSQYIGQNISNLSAPDLTAIINPNCVVTTPGPASNMYSFVCNSSGATMSMYIFNGQTGVLTTNSPLTVVTGTTPVAVFVTPDCRFAYTLSTGSSAINQFSLNILTGVATTIFSPVTLAGTNFGAMHPSGKFLYATIIGSNLVYMIPINQSTGQLGTPVSIASTNPYGIVISPNGYWAYVANLSAATISMFSINQSTGALTALSTATIPSAFPYKMAITPDGKYLYCTNTTNSSISKYKISRGTGILTVIGSADATGSNPIDIVCSPDNRFIYFINQGGPNIGAYAVNDDGTLTILTPATIPTGSNPVSIAISSTGRYILVANKSGNSVGMYIADRVTGTLTANGTATIATGLSPNSIVLF